jgi:hypothetical protein
LIRSQTSDATSPSSDIAPAEAAGDGDEAAELVVQLAGRNDQRADAGADQCAAQHHERGGKATHRDRGRDQPGDPAAGHDSGEGRGVGREPPDVVEEPADRDPQRPGGPGDGGHRVRHGLERRRCCDRKLVREPAPDQPEPGDRVVGALDAVGIRLGDHDAEVTDVLGRLPERRGIDARHGDAAFLAEELSGDRGALGGGDEVGDRRVDAADPLVERQRQQVGGGEPEPAERLGRGPGARGRLAQPPGQVLGRLLDARHGDAGEPARPFQHLDRGDGGAERLGELRLRVDRGEAGADHGDAAGCRRGDGRRGRDLHPRREGGEPGVGRLHLATEPAEAAVAGLADAFELGAHLASADHRQPDGHPFLSHVCLRSPR